MPNPTESTEIITRLAAAMLYKLQDKIAEKTGEHLPYDVIAPALYNTLAEVNLEISVGDSIERIVLSDTDHIKS